ncbi:MAG: ribosomal protein L7/L12 [Planctomycetia bacterium]|jgi:ribosomal protein L7/L12
MNSQNHQIPDEAMDQIINALGSGRKIEAIKVYREVTNLGLKEAKDFIETLASQLAEQDPERFSKATAKSGCASVVLLAITVSSTIVYWMLA